MELSVFESYIQQVSKGLLFASFFKCRDTTCNKWKWTIRRLDSLKSNGKRMREDSKGKPSVFVLEGSCVMCGNGVATAVCTYAPLMLSCCPAPWTAVPPTHTHNTHKQGSKRLCLFSNGWKKVALTQLMRTTITTPLTYLQHSVPNLAVQWWHSLSVRNRRQIIKSQLFEERMKTYQKSPKKTWSKCDPRKCSFC